MEHKIGDVTTSVAVFVSDDFCRCTVTDCSPLLSHMSGQYPAFPSISRKGTIIGPPLSGYYFGAGMSV